MSIQLRSEVALCRWREVKILELLPPSMSILHSSRGDPVRLMGRSTPRTLTNQPPYICSFYINPRLSFNTESQPFFFPSSCERVTKREATGACNSCLKLFVCNFYSARTVAMLRCSEWALEYQAPVPYHAGAESVSPSNKHDTPPPAVQLELWAFFLAISWRVVALQDKCFSRVFARARVCVW